MNEAAVEASTQVQVVLAEGLSAALLVVEETRQDQETDPPSTSKAGFVSGAYQRNLSERHTAGGEVRRFRGHYMNPALALLAGGDVANASRDKEQP